MRAYFFGNMYLSSIQQGIQAAHVVSEMFTQYPDREEKDSSFLWEWAIHHKTMILLNGGYMETMEELMNFFKTIKNPYPWSPFYEGHDSLGGILTSIGIVLPEKIYKAAAAIRSERPGVQFNRDGSYTLRYIIEEQGGFTSNPNDSIQMTITEPTHFEVSKWEFELMNRLNEFRLAQ